MRSLLMLAFTASAAAYNIMPHAMPVSRSAQLVPSIPKVLAHTQTTSASVTWPRAAAPSMALGLLAPAAKYVVAVPTLYALMSVNEYCTHRWYQHAEFNKEAWMQRIACFLTGRKEYKIRGGGHVEHHAETYDDMTLKKDDRWRRTPAAASLDNDRFRGTAFTWKTTGLMTFQMLFSTLPVFHLLGFSLPMTMVILLPGMLLHAAAWNMLHPPMHGLGNVPSSVGASSSWLSWALNSRYFRYIYENHQGHHVLGGQCNYNVCCPGTDHLLGTYVPVSQWAPKMRAVPAEDAVERWGAAREPLGVPQAPIAGATSARTPALAMKQQE